MPEAQLIGAFNSAMLAPTPAAAVFKRECTGQVDWTSSADHPCSDTVTSTDRAMLGGDADVNEVQLISCLSRLTKLRLQNNAPRITA